MNLIAPLSKRQKEYYFRCLGENWFNVAEGGKRGGKNVLNTLAFCTLLEIHPSKIHLVAGVSTATARLNILDCDGYGLLNFFEGRNRSGEYQGRKCLYVGTPRGEKIVLVSGGGKAGDEKLIKGNTYGMAYITEANECHPAFVQEVFDRTVSSPRRKVLHDLNPKAEGHWYYTDVLKFHEDQKAEDRGYGYNYGHFTIADNMSLSDDHIRVVLKTYDKSSVWYARDMLGQRKAAEGLVYPMFKGPAPTMEREYEQYYISVDYGIQNPMAMLLWGLHKGVWYLVREFYHSGRNSKQQKTDEEYYAELERLAGERAIRAVIVDPSAASFIVLIERKRKFKVWDAENSVLEGIQHTAQAMWDGKIAVNDCCKETLRELGLYQWDTRGQGGKDAVIKENDHAMDAMRYFVETTRAWEAEKEELAWLI